ncbi:type VII secretion protein EssA [Lentibacillus sp. N15]|uniref:type VII secretion protein EssA n=1 Tax=Lentibacillus songyuanensis TaxID=3136161 RepID=UPI0031B9D4DB
MMKRLLKQISILSLCLSCLLLILPFTVSANDSQENKGKLQWKIDRIVEGKKKNTEKTTETELEKKFPELFKEETKKKIDSVKTEDKESIEDLEHSLFTMDPQTDTTIKDVKQSLFTAEYTTPETTDNEDQDEQGNSWFNNVLLAGLTGIACIVCGGVYIMMRKLTD